MTSRKSEPQDLLAMLVPIVREVGVAETARRAGMPQPMVSNIVNGRACTIETFARLCAAAGVDVSLKASRRPR